VPSLPFPEAASDPAPVTRSCTHARPPVRVASAACLAAGQPPPCALAAVARLPRFYTAGVRDETRRQILSSLGRSFVNLAPRNAKSGHGQRRIRRARVFEIRPVNFYPSAPRVRISFGGRRRRRFFAVDRADQRADVLGLLLTNHTMCPMCVQ
jgi:hypothetical protein